MITREELKRRYIEWLDEQIKEHGEEFVCLVISQVGKCCWTLQEIKNAVETDIYLKSGPNPIDDMLGYYKLLEEGVINS